MLKFLGRGSGFSDVHNGACFKLDDRLVLIDCPLITFNRLKNEGLNNVSKQLTCTEMENEVNEILIAITHTHSDHIGGLALTIHYATFVWCKHVTVIAPSAEVKSNLAYLLENLDGCDSNIYNLMTVDEYKKENGSEWLQCAVSTTHVPALSGKCFGYSVIIEGKKVIYTGDTNTLEPFMPYITGAGTKGSVLYTECSAVDSGVHMYIDNLLKYETTFIENDIKVYLMHLDNVYQIEEKIKGSSFELAPLL